jgi:hypothetical protein
MEPETLEYKLQKFDPGVVLLDTHNRVVAMNDIAQRVLGNIRGDPMGRDVLQLHPEKSRQKIELLLRAGAADGHAASPPPMTMMINIPDRVLLIKVTKLSDGGQMQSTCMMFYDLTDITTRAGGRGSPAGRPKQLVKVPVLQHNRVVLLAMSDVVHMQAEGHYTRIFTFDQDYDCNLSLTDLEQRLSPDQFIRTHRSHIVNLQHVQTVERDGEQYRLALDTRDSARVPISRGRVDDVRQYFGLT